MGTRRNEYGEGNYQATRRYNEATKTFIDAGRVERAARKAAPSTPAEAASMVQAERAALLRAKVQPDGSVDDSMPADTSRRSPKP